MNWKKLPIENQFLKEIVISGNGKDCKLTLQTKESDTAVSFAMRAPRLAVDIKGNVITESFNYGDSDLGFKYLPGEEILVTLAEIDFPGRDGEWAESLNRFNNGESEFLGWMICHAKFELVSSNSMNAST